jgi:Catalytic LigB subunit of aromatic ring-opening dioxygenase
VARPVIALGTSHGPQLVTEPGLWPTRVVADRRNRHFHRGTEYSFAELATMRRADRDWAGETAPDTWRAKHGKCQEAIGDLARRFRAARPDLAVIFGNDQSEIFTDANIPAFAVYRGATIDNIPKSAALRAQLPPGVAEAEEGYCPPVIAHYPGAPDLADHLIKSLIADEFDVAQMGSLPTGPRGHNGIPHAFGFVYRRIMEDNPVPSVPLIVNNYYEPNKPTVRRCLGFGRAVARAVRSFPGEARVALVASGGLTHFAIDEELDRRVLKAMAEADFAALERIPESAFLSPGTGEIKNWIPLAAAAAELGMRMTLVDYVPCYRSEAGTGTAMAFAYWAA